MFKITDAEKLRDAYTLLAFIRDTTTAEQKSGMAAFIASIHRENYRRVYGGEIPAVPEVGRMLLRLFALFNGSNRPVDFSGHSMSVSDIVRLTEDGASSWWYCDPYGWMELNEEEWGQT